MDFCVHVELLGEHENCYWVSHDVNCDKIVIIFMGSMFGHLIEMIGCESRSTNIGICIG